MNNYWEKRAAQRMYEDMKTAEEAAEDIRRLYGRASLYIQMQGQDIFDAFRRQTGLSEAEARRYLMQAKTPSDMQAVISFVNQIQDPVKRQEILNWVKASATQSRLAKLASLQEAMDNLLPFLYMRELALHRQAYQKIIQSAYLHKIFDIQQYAGFAKHVTPMNAKRIDKLMRARWLGSNYSSRLWGNTERLAKSLRDELMVSFLTGRPQLEAWRAIDTEFDKGQHAARRLIRTESNYLANQAQEAAYKDSGIEKYIYVATLDLRTSEMCRSLDGKVFAVKDAQPGMNYPPMHPWCRSTTIAWMPKALLKKLKRTARDPVTGKNYQIPADMTYNEWYSKFVKNNQDTTQPHYNKHKQYSEHELLESLYEKYKECFGDDFPYTFDEFIQMRADKDLWEAWEKSYLDSQKSDKYKDLTAVWKHNLNTGTAKISDAEHYTAPDGKRYIVDGTNVLQNHTIEEKQLAGEVSKAIGEPVEMVPEVGGEYKLVKTPDFITASGERWEEKAPRFTSKDPLRNHMDSRKAEHYVFDTGNKEIEMNTIIDFSERIFSQYNVKYVKTVALYENGDFIKVLKR